METLTTILHELRSERRGIHEEGVRNGGMAPGHDDMMRGQTTRRFGGEGGNSSLGEKSIEEKTNPQEGIFFIMTTGWRLQRKQSSSNTYMI